MYSSFMYLTSVYISACNFFVFEIKILNLVYFNVLKHVLVNVYDIDCVEN